MGKISRREFLRSVLLSAGGITVSRLLAGCGLETDKTSEGSVEKTNVPKQTDNDFITTPATTHSPASKIPDVAVARGGEPVELVKRALAVFGGMGSFVEEGAVVVVKPNICVAYHTYEYAATTNPWVVGAVVRSCLEAGAKKVMVMDNPFGGTAEEAYARSGIEEQVKAAGGEMVVMTNFKFASTKIPNGKSLSKIDIYDEVLKADVLIDVPIAKHHNLARLSLGMKNLMGVIQDRGAIHRDLGQRLADLNSRVKPNLTVIDAVRILMDNGPTGGNLNDVKQMDTIIISPDIVAADSYAASLFGLRPEDLSYIQAGMEMNLGRSDLENLRIEEVSVGG